MVKSVAKWSAVVGVINVYGLPCSVIREERNKIFSFDI